MLIRFGVGLDLLINIFCTVAGYIPGHFHNFWIQNIRNNSNEKHSPRWAVKAGLVKDYNKSKLKKRGWTGRYEDDGATGGVSYHGQKRWEQTEVIVDPITGETRKVAVPQPAQKKERHSAFPSPWANDPLDEEEDDEDFEGPEEAGRQQYASSSSARRQAQPPPKVDNRKRDPITGAIIEDYPPARDDDDPYGGSLGADSSYGRNNGSRKSLHDQYAERYNLGSSSAGASKSSLSSGKNKRSNGYGGGAPGEGDAGVRQGKKSGGIGGFFGGKKGKKGNQQQQEQQQESLADLNGYSRPAGRDDGYGGSGGRTNGSASRAPAGGAFGNDDALDRELQGVSGSSSAKRAPARSNGYSNGYSNPSAPSKSMGGRQDAGGYGQTERVRGDGLSHQF